MTSIQIPDEGGNKFTINVNIGAFAINTQKVLMNNDDTPNLVGEKKAYYFNQPADITEEAIEARGEMMRNIEAEFVKYYKLVNNL